MCTLAANRIAMKCSAFLALAAAALVLPHAAGAGVSAEKFVSQIAVAMLDIDEIKTQLPGHECRTM